MGAALVLQTQDNCPPGLLGDWAKARALELDVLRADRWDPLPAPAGYGFAVVLGSDAPVVDTTRDWVARVVDWIAGADAAGVPVLGSASARRRWPPPSADRPCDWPTRSTPGSS